MMLATPINRGLGSYWEVTPEDDFYDPNRPAWLPRWWLTSSEYAKKWGLYPDVSTLDTSTLTTPPVTTPPVPPGSYTVGGGVYDPDAVDKLIAASWAKQTQANIEHFKTLSSEEKERQRKLYEESWFEKYKWWLAGGAGLLVIGMLGAQRMSQ